MSTGFLAYGEKLTTSIFLFLTKLSLVIDDIVKKN